MSTLSQTRRQDLTAQEGGSVEEPALYVVLEGERPRSGGMRIPLSKVDELRIGRAAEGRPRSFRLEDDRKAALEIPDPNMSGKHARFVREDGGWLIEDMQSTNGTFVEGKRITSALLEEDTVITLGATVLSFEPEEVIPPNTKSDVVVMRRRSSRVRAERRRSSLRVEHDAAPRERRDVEALGAAAR